MSLTLSLILASVVFWQCNDAGLFVITSGIPSVDENIISWL